MFKGRKLLLVDGFGAMVSAISLGVLLPIFQSYIGLPTEILLILASIAGLFACYSCTAYFFARDWWKRSLQIIAIFNIAYCLLTAGLLWFHADSLQTVGILYFVGEIVLVCGLATWELRIARS